MLSLNIIPSQNLSSAISKKYLNTLHSNNQPLPQPPQNLTPRRPSPLPRIRPHRPLIQLHPRINIKRQPQRLQRRAARRIHIPHPRLAQLVPRPAGGRRVARHEGAKSALQRRLHAGGDGEGGRGEVGQDV